MSKVSLLVISSAPLIKKEGRNFLYAPYQKEMKIWAKHSSKIQFCCPIWNEDKNLLIDEIDFQIETTIALKEFDVTRLQNFPKAIIYSFINIWILFNAIRKANHIHLRCPGNMTLLASFVQILFPSKRKTVKYAGNWDPKAKQPITYKIQRLILSNTFLTKNMQVLVYGEWANQTKNIKPFFTATYSESDKKDYIIRYLSGRIRFLFVGMLSEGKQPLYAAHIIKQLILKGFDVQLDYFGEGKMRDDVEKFCINNNLTNRVFLRGNQPKDVLKIAYQESHFLLLPSKSEGWPKAVAEAMFWGCVPVVTEVSCLPYMLGNGERGVILDQKLILDVKKIETVLRDDLTFQKMSKQAQVWSQQFTVDKFEKEIQKMI